MTSGRHGPHADLVLRVAGCLESTEREVLLGVIGQQRWNMSQVAAQLGISRNTLYRKIKRHGIAIDRRPVDP
jgi:transcriptional regulator of acetoin/glycerol metabolism